MSNTSIKYQYDKDGYLFPVDALSSQQALAYGERIKAIAESEYADQLGNRGQLNQLHVLCPFVNDIIRNSAVLDVVEQVLGPNILVWGTSVFLKPANSSGYVSWHQDLTYWGLSSELEMSAWFALGEVNEDNGCMHFLPGSHKQGQKPHSDFYDETNILTRGQRVDYEIDDRDTVAVELQPGQVSLHHGYTMHKSGPNNTDQPRVGMVVNYISTSVYQTVTNLDFGMLVRGEDTYNHFESIPVPKADFDEDGIAFHQKMMSAHNDVIYDGAKNTESSATQIT